MSVVTHFALRFGGETRLGGPVVCHFRLRIYRISEWNWEKRTSTTTSVSIDIIYYARPWSTVINSIIIILCCGRDGWRVRSELRRTTFVQDWSKITTDWATGVGGGLSSANRTVPYGFITFAASRTLPTTATMTTTAATHPAAAARTGYEYTTITILLFNIVIIYLFVTVVTYWLQYPIFFSIRLVQ